MQVLARSEDLSAALAIGIGAPDSDDDGMEDAWELAHGLDPADPSDASGDADDEGVSNLREFRLGLDPNAADTDADGADDAGRVGRTSGAIESR